MSSLIPNSRIKRLKETIDVRLDSYLSSSFTGPSRLIEAMRYAVMSPGKRLRGTLCLLIAEDLGGFEAAVPVACSLEFLHAASLIVDDLPCMDDEDERRGRPATHVAYSEDLAILAAFSLVSSAFGIISSIPSADPAALVHLTSLFSDALGVNGLCAGQARDLASAAQAQSEAEYNCTIVQKTASLFILAVLCGAAFAQPALSKAEEEILKSFGTHAGLGFQAQDDAQDQLDIAHPETLMIRAEEALSAATRSAKQLTRLPSLFACMETGWFKPNGDLFLRNSRPDSNQVGARIR